MGNVHVKMLLASAVGVTLCAAGAQAAFIGPYSMEQFPYYQYSTGYQSGITTDILGDSTPPDPFGPAGNHSLRIDDASTANTARVDWWNTST
jgi:hypothetical protein